MKPWQMRLHRLLAEREGPPVLSRDLLNRFATTARNGHPVPPSTLSHWIGQATRQGQLLPVQRGLYLNAFRPVPGQPADAASWLRAEAIVSLNTVLGDAGVLNNPVHAITAVAPFDPDSPPPPLGRQTTRVGTFHFFGLPRRIMEAGEVSDRLEPVDRFEHPRATPERALIDWLYLGRSAHSRRTPPPRGDLDLELLDAARLQRLARATGLEDTLSEFMRA